VIAVAWRRHPASPGVPEELARFVASEWPAAKCPHEALRQWMDACADWLAADSSREPRPGTDGMGRWWLAGRSNRHLPFGQYGDVIDVLRVSGRCRRGMPACPHEYRPAQHWTNGETNA
jgi:hypothetical protein